MTADGAMRTVGSQVKLGLAWKLLSQVFQQLLRVGVVVVLARLLTPHDYGVAAMVLVFSTLVFIFADLSLGAALVQRKTLSEADRSTVFWTATAAGAAFTALGVALAGPIASFYGEEEVRPLFMVLSASFLLTSLGTVQTSLLTREMSFRSLELRVMAGSVAGAAVGIAIAVLGGGPWAIIGQQLAATAASTVLLWAFCPWRPRLLFSNESLRRLAGFGANVFGTRLLFYANRNADNLLIGRFIGPSALGAYALAYNLMLAPMSRIAQPVVEVLFPAFSRMQDDTRALAAAWTRTNRLVGAITIPAMLGLIAVAPDFVSVVFGNRWAAATPVIQILAWVGLLQSLQRLNSSILQARDETRTLLWYSIVVLVASLTAFAIGLHWGIIGVASAYAVSSTLVEPYYAWLTARSIGLSFGDVIRSYAGVFAAGGAMFGCVLAARAWLVPESLPDGARLAVLILIGSAVFVPFCAWWAPEVVNEVRLVRAGRRGSTLGPQAAER